tara:strand:- start:97 stop:420 length:324 start_codon:yes stop_codon:yes gene_type:complete
MILYKSMGGKMIEAYAWKDSREEEESTYKVQLELIDIPKRKQNKIIKLFQDWKQFVEGGSPKNKRVILGYRKEFGSEREWNAWVREFPHTFYQLKKNGTFRLIKKGN